MNRKFVDEFAVEFCLSMNFKGNRARLARALFNVDKNRSVSSHAGIAPQSGYLREDIGRILLFQAPCLCNYMYMYMYKNTF